METLERTIFWRNLQLTGSEYFELWRDAEGWRLRGAVIVALAEDRPMHVEYEVKCDNEWRTRRLWVSRAIGDDARSLILTVEGAGRWRRSGTELPELNGCVDVDLAVSPATNTLPIRRLDLPLGHTAKTTAAWVRFPDLTIEPLAQTYTRLDQHRYLYESATGFSTEIEVDDFGVVVQYPCGWECVASR